MSDAELLIKTLLHQARLHNKQGASGLGLLFTNAAQEIEKLQAENAELKKKSNKQVRKVLCEIGTEFENDTRINKKSMPFVREIVINKIYDYPTPPEGE